MKTVTLPPSMATIPFIWNTTDVSVGNYTLKAVASRVFNEKDILDNTYDGISVTVTSWKGTVFFIDPLISYASPGDQFTVNVWVYNITVSPDIWQFKILCQNNILSPQEVLRGALGRFLAPNILLL